MSGVFMDGGGGDSMSLGGDGVDHGGGHDHGSHGIHHGHGQGGHNFLAQILGLDQQEHAHLAHHGAEGAEGQAPSQTASWNSALQGLKLENLIAGINITPNFLLFMLFASFVGWLGVIYWIRHHEPFANQVLGSSAAFGPTVGADRQIINDSRTANPVRTSAQSGMVYLPQSGPSNSSPINSGLSAAMSSAFGQQPAPTSAQPTQTYAAVSQNASPVNQGLSAAMSSAFGQAPAANAVQSSQTYAGQSSPKYAAAPQASSPVNPDLSAAMASALGPAPAQNNPEPGATAAGPTSLGVSTYAPNYSTAPQAYPMSQQSMPMAASAPMAAGSLRLFSSRRAMMAQAAQAPAPSQAPPPPSQFGQTAASAAAVMPVAPVENPNTWSLANQGHSTFSSDTAQFNSQFGAPLDLPSTGATSISGSGSGSGPASGAYSVTPADGTRSKVVTDR